MTLRFSAKEAVALVFFIQLAIFQAYSFRQGHHKPHSARFRNSHSFTNHAKTWNSILDIKMPGVSPRKAEEYICTSTKRLPRKTSYIIKYEPHAKATTAHHILLFGCKYPGSRKKSWKCDGRTCQGSEKIIYAWAKNAKAVEMPKDVGFAIGGSSGIDYIVMQIHYAKAMKENEKDYSGIKLHVTNRRMKHLAEIYSFASDHKIPPHSIGFHVDVACGYRQHYDMIPFAFRTHAHSTARVISGYRVRKLKWKLIGIGNPQLPQVFYPIPPANRTRIHYGDILAVRCTYDTPHRNRWTLMGATSKDEMCNFYMMYYKVYRKGAVHHKKHNFDEYYNECSDFQYNSLTKHLKYPSASDKLPNYLKTNGTHHHHHMQGSPRDEDDVESDSNEGRSDAKEDGSDSNEGRSDSNEGRSDVKEDGSDSNEGGSDSNEDGPDTNEDRLLSAEDREENPDEPTDEFDLGQDSDNDKDLDLLAADNDSNSHGAGENLEKSDKTVAGDKKIAQAKHVAARPSDTKSAKSTNPKSSPAEKTQKVDSAGKHSEERKKDSHKETASKSNAKTSKSENDIKPKKHAKTDSLDNMEEDLNDLMSSESRIGEKKEKKKAPLSTSKVSLRPTVNGDWPYERDGLAGIGQATGLALDKKHVVVLHRAYRVWNRNTFDRYDQLTRKYRSRITKPTVLHLDPSTGAVVEKWGENRFFLPHGLTIDSNNNIWITDVGAHQVMKFSYKDKKRPALTLGVALTPGDDDDHFCKPADVAVESSGVFYVADGYCNNRIMKFSAAGDLIHKWGRETRGLRARPGEFNIPHSLALDEANGLLYVADRENGRIQCFDTHGRFQKQIHHEEFGGRLFAVSYSPANGGVLLAVSGQSHKKNAPKPSGFTLNPKTGKIIFKWSPFSRGFNRPHDIQATPDNSAIYVSEIGPNRVWKFDCPVQSPHHPKKGKTDQTRAAKPQKIKPTQPTHSLPAETNDDEEDASSYGLKKPVGEDTPIVPAIVVVAVLATPIALICAAATIQHLRFKRKRENAINKRNSAALMPKSRNGCFSCCKTKKYYYDNKRGFDKLIGEDDSEESSDDYFVRKGAI